MVQPDTAITSIFAQSFMTLDINNLIGLWRDFVISFVYFKHF